MAGEDDVIVGKKAIMGALALNLDFLNLFLMLTQLFDGRRRYSIFSKSGYRFCVQKCSNFLNESGFKMVAYGHAT